MPASFGGLSATGKIGGMTAGGKLSSLKATGKVNGMTAGGLETCFQGHGTMNGATTSNDLKRSYSYKTGTLTFPATPQSYSQEWEDANGVFWQCFAGDTVWEKINHLAPGV